MSDQSATFSPHSDNQRQMLVDALLSRKDVARLMLYKGWADEQLEHWVSDQWFHGYRHDGRHATVEIWAARFSAHHKPDQDKWSSWKMAYRLDLATRKIEKEGRSRRL